MPNVSSPLGTANSAIPLVNATQLSQAAGLHIHFPTLAALNTAITAERANIAAANPIWADGQPITVSGEGAAIRRWSVSAQHARNVTLPGGTPLLLAADATSVAVPVGGSPVSGCSYDSNSNLTGYTQNGISYVITYTTVNGFTVPATKVGGGRTITYSYNGNGQLQSEAYS